jgi:hypothetical protein
MTKLKKYNFIFVLFAVALYGGYSFRLLELLSNRNLLFLGGDLTFFMFAIKIGMQGNLDGTSDILGWPNGFALFSEPLLGTGPFFAAILISKLLFIQNVFIVYILTVITGMLINTIAAYWMVSKEYAEKKYSYIFAFIVGIAPFVLMRLHHLSILWLYFFLVIFGIYFRLERSQINFKKAILIVSFFGFWSPLFWLFVTIFISLSLITIYLILYKIYIKQLKIWLSIFSGSAAAFLFNYFLIYINRDYRGTTSRFPWQSNVFGGRFADILVSSPFINSKINLLEKLSEGLSPGGTTSSVGIVLGIGVILTLLFSIVALQPKKLNLPLGFTGILVILWLFFLSGGLGNFQAALLLLLDQTTPLRAWFRILVVLGILGFYLSLKLLETFPIQNYFKNIVLFLIVIVSIIDGQHLKYIEFTEKKDVIEYSAVKFLESETKDCPVLQIPVDTFPLMQDFIFSNGQKFYYNHTIPYILSDNNQWSLYAIPGNKFFQQYKDISTEIDSVQANLLASQGFCAILFDKDFSQWQIDRQAGLDFTIGKWPGLKMNLGKADFDNGRYQVYLLSK